MQNFFDRELGKVVVYITTLGVLRETYARCVKVRQILRTLLIKTVEKDVFMSKENQLELAERMDEDASAVVTTVPQVFVDGRLLGVRENQIAQKDNCSLFFSSHVHQLGT